MFRNALRWAGQFLLELAGHPIKRPIPRRVRPAPSVQEAAKWPAYADGRLILTGDIVNVADELAYPGHYEITVVKPMEVRLVSEAGKTVNLLLGRIACPIKLVRRAGETEALVSSIADEMIRGYIK